MTQEGELISYVQETEDYDIDYYVEKIGKIAARKLQIYMQLRDKMLDFKKSLKEEEEMHRASLAKKNGIRLKQQSAPTSNRREPSMGGGRPPMPGNSQRK